MTDRTRTTNVADAPVALVTGGGSGIGQAIAATLRRAGYRLALCSRSADGASDGDLAVACDARSEVQVREAVRRVVGELGRIDVLINSAGVSMPEPMPIGEIPTEVWDRINRTNSNGVFHFCSAVVPLMRTAGSGTIVNILSTASHAAGAGNAPYAASKYAARALTETLRLECRGTPIRVFSVSPGPVDTPIWDHKTRDVGSEERGRMLAASDIADVVEFLITRPEHVRIGDIVITPSEEARHEKHL